MIEKIILSIHEVVMEPLGARTWRSPKAIAEAALKACEDAGMEPPCVTCEDPSHGHDYYQHENRWSPDSEE